MDLIKPKKGDAFRQMRCPFLFFMVKLDVHEVETIGELTGVYKDRLEIDYDDELLSISINSVEEDGNIKLHLNKLQCRLLADILLRMADQLTD